MSDLNLVELLQARNASEITTLQLRSFIVEMELGILPQEQGVTQRIQFDVDLHLEGAKPPDEDQIDHVLDYDFIRGRIEQTTSSSRLNMLETLVSELLDSFMMPEEVVAASVTATKLDIYDGPAEVGCRMFKIRK